MSGSARPTWLAEPRCWVDDSTYRAFIQMETQQEYEERKARWMKRDNRKMRFLFVIDCVAKAVIIGLPVMGLYFATSILWNAAWWGIWGLWTAWVVGGEAGTTVHLRMVIGMLPLAIVYEAALDNQILSIITGVWFAVLAVSSATQFLSWSIRLREAQLQRMVR